MVGASALSHKSHAKLWIPTIAERRDPAFPAACGVPRSHLFMLRPSDSGRSRHQGNQLDAPSCNALEMVQHQAYTSASVRASSNKRRYRNVLDASKEVGSVALCLCSLALAFALELRFAPARDVLKKLFRVPDLTNQRPSHKWRGRVPQIVGVVACFTSAIPSRRAVIKPVFRPRWITSGLPAT
jgi:hypothetical protein